MNLIDLILIRYERHIAISMSVLLIVLNLSNLYFIITLLDYDEIVGYQPDGGIKSSDPKDVGCLLLITMLLNLLFVFSALCAWIMKKNQA